MNVNRKGLKAALAASKRFTSARPGIPALTGVLLEAGPDGLTMTTTDLEASWTATLPGASDPWRVLVGRAILAEAVKSGPERVNVNPDGHGGLTVDRATFRGLPIDDFPNLPDEAGPVVAVVEAQALRAGLTITTPAASRDEARPVLTGVFAEVTPEGIGLTATDSYRLHHAEVATEHVDYLNPHGVAAIIPARALEALARIIGAKGSGAVEVTFDGSTVTFGMPDGSRIGSRIIEGEYPNYRQLVPDADGTVSAVFGPDLLEVVKAAGTFAGDLGPVRFDWRAGIGAEVTASSPDLGAFAATYAAPEVAEDVCIALNPAYLGDALAAIGAGTMGVRDGLKPCVLRSFDGPAYALVMPVRLPAPIAAVA